MHRDPVLTLNLNLYGGDSVAVTPDTEHRYRPRLQDVSDAMQTPLHQACFR